MTQLIAENPPCFHPFTSVIQLSATRSPINPDGPLDSFQHLQNRLHCHKKGGISVKTTAWMLLELLRILLLLPLIGALLWSTVLGPLYEAVDVSDPYRVVGAAGVWVFLFIIYRNYLQFSGWYKEKERRKLPRGALITLTVVSLLMTIGPLFLGLNGL